MEYCVVLEMVALHISEVAVGFFCGWIDVCVLIMISVQIPKESETFCC